MVDKILIRPETLEHSYIPEKLPRRENVRRDISSDLIDFFQHGFGFTSWIIYGGAGAGKTVLSHRVGNDVKKVFDKDLILVYVNCKGKRSYRVLTEIVHQIESSIPERGLSRDDLMNILYNLILDKGGSALIILDELSDLFRRDKIDEINKAKDFLYALSRLPERQWGKRKIMKLAVIGVIWNRYKPDFILNLDNVTRASFIKNEVKLKPYSVSDLTEILEYRASLAFREGSVSSEAIELIANFAVNSQPEEGGNARIAMDILRDAGRYVDRIGAGYLDVEHVRMVLKYHPELPRIDSELIMSLDRHKLVLLLSIIKAFRLYNKSFITRAELEEIYKETCEEYRERPRKTTQLLRYLKELSHELPGVIEVEVTGKGQRGRSTRIRVNVPLDDLEKSVISLLRGEKIV